jgi:hypothetical protein
MPPIDVTAAVADVGRASSAAMGYHGKAPDPLAVDEPQHTTP